MRNLIADVGAALTHLRRSPGFCTVVIVLLAIALGGSIAMFSAVKGMLLEPLPYAEAERLVRVGHEHRERGRIFGAFSPDDYRDLVARSTAFDASAAFLFWPGQTTVNSRIGDRPEQLHAAYVSEGFFGTLVAPALLGRALGPADMVAGADRVTVLSHRAWRTLFAADPSVVGRDVSINGEPMTVIGVMSPEFDFPQAQVQVWLPWSQITDTMIPHRRDVRWLDVVARLAPGVNAGAAQREADAVLANLAKEYPDSNSDYAGAQLQPLLDTVVGKDRGPMLALFMATLLVLVTACVNLANLLLVRVSRRARELAVKGAIGAAPARLARQSLAEALLLAIAGGVAGLALAGVAVRVFSRAVDTTIARAGSFAVDPGVTAFALALVLLTALACGLLPALRVRCIDPARALGRSAAGAASSADGRLRTGLVVAQVALVCALGYGAGVVIDSLRRLATVDLGVDAESVLTFNVKLNGGNYDAEGGIARGRAAILARLREMPGVISVAGSKNAAIGETGERYGFALADAPENILQPEWGTLFVTNDYFRTLGIPLQRGRDFAEREIEGAPLGLIVNQAFAERYIAGADPVGKTLLVGGNSAEIVGLVANARHAGPSQRPQPVVYAPSSRFNRSSLAISIRASARGADLIERARDAVWSVDPNLPILGMQWLDQGVTRLQAQPRLLAAVLGGFALLAALIGGIGIYSLLAYVVAARRRELAVRLAVGAQPERLFRDVVGQGARLAGWGLLAGVPLGMLAARSLDAMLYEPASLSPLVMVAIAAGALLLAMAASAAPAATALRIHPMTALRDD